MAGWVVDHIWIFADDDNLVEVLGTAPDACPFFDAVLTETLDGVDKLEFSIPGDHPRAEKVVRGCIAVFEDIDGQYRAFRIQTQWQVSGEDGTRYRRFYCEDIAIDELNAAPVIDRRPSDPVTALTNALENSIWQVGHVDSGFPPGSTNFYHESAMSCLQKMVETWGGEVRFRITHDGQRITGRYVDFLLQRGSDNGRRITVGKDMRTIEAEEDITGLVTALYGYGKGEETETGGYGRRISFADVEWSVANGDPVDKPLGQEWVGDPDALALWGLKGGTIHRFGFVVFEDVEDPAELLQKTWEELQKRKAPRTSYRIGMADLEAAEGLEHEAVRIGDWVTAIDDDMSPPMEFKARVIERKNYLNEPEKTEVTIGHVQPTLVDVINRVDRELGRTIKVGDPINFLDTVFETLADELRTTPGYSYITPTDGILVTDKPKDQNPTSAIQLKGGMLAIANEWDPEKGDFRWRAFGTGDGFTASEITTGTLNANLVEVISVDLATGTNRRVELYDGNVYTYYQEKLTMAMTGYSLDFFDHGDFSDGSNTGKLTGKLELAWSQAAGDPPDESNARGVALVTLHDFLGLARTTQEDEFSFHEFALYWNRAQNRAYLSGPSSGGDWSKFWRLVFSADHHLGELGNFADGPYFEIGIGKISGQHNSGVAFVIGDKYNNGDGRYFVVWENLDGSGTRYRALDLNQWGLYLYRNYLYFREPKTGTTRGWIYAYNGGVSYVVNSDNYIGQNTSGDFFVIAGGSTRHILKKDGTKTGGTIQLSDGKTWGMSPVDSPQVLIEDVLWGMEMTGEEVFIPIDAKFSEAVGGSYAVFSSRGDVVVTRKEPGGFYAKGPAGPVDFRVIGKRHDSANVYWIDMDAEKPPAPPALPEETAVRATRAVAEKTQREVYRIDRPALQQRPAHRDRDSGASRQPG